MARSFSFPHPVLGHNDDVEGDFEFISSPLVQPDLQDPFWRLGGKFRLSNMELGQAVKDQRAAFQVRIICDSTYLRRSFRADPGSDEISWIEIPSGDLWGMVRIQPLLVATDSIDEYLPSDVHPDYGDAAFEVKASQILAVATEYTFHIDDDYDPLQVPVGTILQVDGEAQGDLREVDYSGDKITVSLPGEIFSLYDILKQRHISIIISMIAAPVFTEAIRKVRDPESAGDVSGTLWFSRLGEMLDAREEELGCLEPGEAAEALLNGSVGSHDGYALSRAFAALDELDQQGGVE